ncbi:hypothetical protein LOAG_05486 [Loa loa]|uniref:Uncharacterized protein n=1 Tax=Loa loa TaxID=7209 RepID=A0A1S0U073_LOALO|nr:hypothetical protein LOAG_05486 [Loa loa]EFO23000.1 hypothetical protein LOAG_05486 [Loa loa]
MGDIGLGLPVFTLSYNSSDICYLTAAINMCYINSLLILHRNVLIESIPTDVLAHVELLVVPCTSKGRYMTSSQIWLVIPDVENGSLKLNKRRLQLPSPLLSSSSLLSTASGDDGK